MIWWLKLTNDDYVATHIWKDEMNLKDQILWLVALSYLLLWCSNTAVVYTQSVFWARDVCSHPQLGDLLCLSVLDTMRAVGHSTGRELELHKILWLHGGCHSPGLSDLMKWGLFRNLAAGTWALICKALPAFDLRSPSFHKPCKTTYLSLSSQQSFLCRTASLTQEVKDMCWNTSQMLCLLSLTQWKGSW